MAKNCWFTNLSCWALRVTKPRQESSSRGWKQLEEFCIWIEYWERKLSSCKRVKFTNSLGGEFFRGLWSGIPSVLPSPEPAAIPAAGTESSGSIPVSSAIAAPQTALLPAEGGSRGPGSAPALPSVRPSLPSVPWLLSLPALPRLHPLLSSARSAPAPAIAVRGPRPLPSGAERAAPSPSRGARSGSIAGGAPRERLHGRAEELGAAPSPAELPGSGSITEQRSSERLHRRAEPGAAPSPAELPKRSPERLHHGRSSSGGARSGSIAGGAPREELGAAPLPAELPGRPRRVLRVPAA
ncbi:skin secretory protein xP2-like [Pyrgilauda ruficollis]|uniref:skin secretory protein xP2-like n=1 Tax=Pyrgilauda ruficollis TaxID=221976 RepID=UPI001B880B28|nr:skin secretory protein xP2-like [Pyrgilauda ruficollis]